MLNHTDGKPVFSYVNPFVQLDPKEAESIESRTRYLMALDDQLQRENYFLYFEN